MQLGISNFSDGKLLRYYCFHKPNFLSLFSIPSCPKTLNPTLTPTPPNNIYQLNSLHQISSLLIFPTVSPLDNSLRPSVAQSLVSASSFVYKPSYKCRLPYGYCFWRSYSTGNFKDRRSESMISASFDHNAFKERDFDVFDTYVSSKQVSQIIELIKEGGDGMSSKLNLLNVGISLKSMNEIFRVLNCLKVSGLDFFRWVQGRHPYLNRKGDFASLIIDNCGWLDDYETMVSLLKEFSSDKICLTERAFGFLPVLGSSKDSLMESIRRLIGVLNEAGGSCRNSGICALINMLCTLDSFEMAKFVIEITERKVSYYNILVRQKCLRSHFQEVHKLLKEMREMGCGPGSNTYNYLLGTLLKNDMLAEAQNLLLELKEKGPDPDEIAFEILIYYSCRIGKLDLARHFLAEMISRGLEPRRATHDIYIKGLFYAKEYEEAHKYVLSPSLKHKKSANMAYSLLAHLHQGKGDLIAARNLLIEMMEKGLKPNFPVYLRIIKRLEKTGRRHLTIDLKNMFSSFRVESNAITG